MSGFVFINSDVNLHVILIVIFGIFPVVLADSSTDYCEVECMSGVHTVCERNKNCGPLKECTPIESDVPFRTHMVKAHNEVRNDIASGKIKGPYGNIGAKAMNAISYDMELEYIASCWLNMCNHLQHDLCRNSKRFPVGQNIFSGTNANETALSVPLWFGEIEFFTNPKWLESFTNENYPNDNKMRGHFTQVIWAETKYVGCARVKYVDDEGFQMSDMICNYGPAGNFMYEPIYRMARDASDIGSECKDGKNSEYTSLCGKIDSLPPRNISESGSSEPGSSESESYKSGSSHLNSISYITNFYIVSIFCIFSL